MDRRLALVFVASLGCHVTTQTEVTRPGAGEIIQHPEGAIAHRPTLVLSETGKLRFVEPLECPTERVVSSTTAIEVATRPNLATFVVGVIATGDRQSRPESTAPAGIRPSRRTAHRRR